ncbi:PREDICTED: uncharacterized protein LOC105566575 [Vollenhovia emeryi]|uniref:uncharacterized protein LOC105566575 n=1 Tax=Vollenhovia emeryi TaxID=411798 RepID=UPI0005F584F1|nr:PREDICTED: uncharacterized protein LOC105566575 [Vollenhovia emeryi]
MKMNQEPFNITQHSTVSNSRGEMNDKLDFFLSVVLIIGGVMTVTALLACYAYFLRDLCCPPGRRSKRRRQQNPRRELDNPNRARLDTIPLNDITQGESMPTETEKI